MGRPQNTGADALAKALPIEVWEQQFHWGWLSLRLIGGWLWLAPLPDDGGLMNHQTPLLGH